MTSHLNHQTHEFDVCVIGGGMAGLCAAIAAARHGAKTALIHDRPVFGGNASSEIRMWICGAHGNNNKETGILEEIQLENQYLNPSLNYSIWDSVLYAKAFFQPNLTPFLNCSVADATTEAGTITQVRAWQTTSQTWHAINAKYFVDCSGDSVLGAVTPAEFRQGREARLEYEEDIQPETADEKTMGNSLLIQWRRTEEPQPFTAPSWAYKFDRPGDMDYRMHGVDGHNFWWIEVGGLQNTIKDAESIRDELMKITYGVWDYIKNHAPEKAKAENWALEWMGSLPGKRENRRFMGDHVLTQNDIRGGGAFEDIVAYGGWTMDDHHPAGIYYPGRPTLFHPAPSPYGIPYRSLYSRNINNLFFAGRNISVTHAALSSTRVMATCAIIGQAAGTAAALCTRLGVAPRALAGGSHLRELQTALMEDDCWLPGLTRPVSELALTGKLNSPALAAPLLLDGMERDRESTQHGVHLDLNQPVEYLWPEVVQLGGARLTLDSNLANEKRMPCSYPQKGNRNIVPKSLVKAYRLEALDEGGQWKLVHRESNNYQRLVGVPLDLRARGLRFVPEATWGAPTAHVYAFEPQGGYNVRTHAAASGPHWTQAVARIAPADLAPPESGLEKEAPSRHSA